MPILPSLSQSQSDLARRQGEMPNSEKAEQSRGRMPENPTATLFEELNSLPL
jgi:hypothetical protein